MREVVNEVMEGAEANVHHSYSIVVRICGQPNPVDLHRRVPNVPRLNGEHSREGEHQGGVFHGVLMVAGTIGTYREEEE